MKSNDTLSIIGPIGHLNVFSIISMNFINQSGKIVDEANRIERRE